MKVTFNYTGNHKADEDYMQKMCARGWAAKSLTEGFWTFDQCEPGEYVYRVAYLRGMSRDEVKKFKGKMADQGIEFVSNYTFWAIFRSRHFFEIYASNEELKICWKIYRPMPAGAVISAIILLLAIPLVIRISKWWLILAIAAGVYGLVCTRCGVSYHKLIQKLKKS